MFVQLIVLAAQMAFGTLQRAGLFSKRPGEIAFDEVIKNNAPSEIRPVAYIAGTVAVTPSRIWFGDFSQRAVERDSQWTDYIFLGAFAALLDFITVAYRYYCAECFALCYGPDRHIEQIFIDERLMFQAVAGTDNAGGGLLIDDPQAWGGDQPPGQGGQYSWCDVTRGNYTDHTNAYLESVLSTPPNKTPALRGISLLISRGRSGFTESGYFAAGGLGYIPKFREWKFVLRGQPDNLATGFNKLGRHANPMEVIYEWSTSLEYGARVPITEIDLPSWQQAASDLYDEYQQDGSGGWSGRIDSGTSPYDVVQNVLAQVDGVLDPSPSLGLVMRLIRKDYSLPSLRVLTLDEITAVNNFSPGTYEDTVNKVIVPFEDQDNNFKPRPGLYIDPANQSIQDGRVVPQTQDYKGVGDYPTANALATRDGRALSVPRAVAEMDVTPSFGRLAYQGEALILEWTSPSFSKVMRVQSVTPNTSQRADFTLVMIEDQFATGLRTSGTPVGTLHEDPGVGLDTAPPSATWDTVEGPPDGLTKSSILGSNNQFISSIHGFITFGAYAPGGQYARIWVTEPGGVQTLSPLYLVPDDDLDAEFQWPATGVGIYEFCIQTYSLHGVTDGVKVCASIEVLLQGSPSLSPSASVSPSVSPSGSISPSISVSPSVSPSASGSPSVSPSGSTSPSSSPSPSESGSASPSHSVSPSGSQSPSASVSPSPSTSPSSSASPSTPAGPPTTNLEFWSDANQETGFNNGDQMSAMQDYSGNNRDGTGVSGGGTLPVYRSTDGPNSLPCIRYAVNTGAAGYFTLPNFLTGFTAGHGFAVSKTVLKDSSVPFSGWGSTDDGYYPWSANTLIYDPTATNARKDALTPQITMGAGGTAWHLYEFRSASGAWSMYQDGLLVFSTGTNTVAWGTAPTVGKELGPGRMFIGDIAEIFMYSAIQSGSDLTTIKTYLSSKYGLTIA